MQSLNQQEEDPAWAETACLVDFGQGTRHLNRYAWFESHRSSEPGRALEQRNTGEAHTVQKGMGEAMADEMPSNRTQVVARDAMAVSSVEQEGT